MHWGPAAKRLVWSIAKAGGGPQDVVARRYRRYAEEISVALQVALYGSHLRFLTVSVKAPAILAQAPANLGLRFTQNFVIPAGHMVPLSAETGGRLVATFSMFLKKVVTFGMDFGESPVPVWTEEKRALFASRLRSAHVRISYAIARCVANALIYGSKTIARYPVR